MKILVDMNLSPAWVEYLEARDFEAVHWSSIGRASASDQDVIRWAAERDFVVMTNDLDFGALLAVSGERRPSVIQLRSGSLRPADIGDIVAAAIVHARAELESGALLSLEVGMARLRILPLP
jgi:predicted nuclease of predicted toxin-antitoxin system